MPMAWRNAARFSGSPAGRGSRWPDPRDHANEDRAAEPDDDGDSGDLGCVAQSPSADPGGPVSVHVLEVTRMEDYLGWRGLRPDSAARRWFNSRR